MSRSDGAGDGSQHGGDERDVEAKGCFCFSSSKSGAQPVRNNDVVELDQPKRCTDIVFLALYVIFCLFMVVIGVFAISYGNPLRLINGMDSFGNICGMKNDVIENMNFTGMDMSYRPYVFFFDPYNMADSRKICVQACPEVPIKDLQELQELDRNFSISLCHYDFQSEFLGQVDSAFTAAIAKQMCPTLPYPATKPVLKRCIPKPGNGTDMSGVYGYLNGLNPFSQVLGDLALTWGTTLGLSAVAFLISVVLMLCVHWMTAVLAYIILILGILTSIGFTTFLWLVYFDIKATLDSTPQSQLLEESVKNERAFLTYSIIATLITVILLCIIFYLRSRVKWVVKLFREVGCALKAMPSLLLHPLCTYFILICFFSIWLLVILCLATADYPAARHINVYPEHGVKTSSAHETQAQAQLELPPTVSHGGATMTVLEYSDASWVKYLWWVYILGLIWCSEFILACQKMVIASSISTWYFSRDRGSLNCIILQSILNLTRFHLGSMALGALLITTLRFPRLALSFLNNALKRWQHFKVAQLFGRCCSCCLNCFENWLRGVHHNAYTVIAIQGVNFCPASRLALQAILENTLHLTVMNTVGDVLLFLTKVVVAGLTGIIALLIFRNDDRLYFYAIPVLVSLIFAYFVAHAVISVFEMALDTLFLCFCEDHNMNHSTDSQNFSAPPELLVFMMEASKRPRRGRSPNRDASPIPRKPGPDQTVSNGEELMPMNKQSYEVDT